MTNAIVSRLGQIDAEGDAKALFLKLFSGEVLTSFENKTVTMGRHVVRTITNGKSAQFPVTGRTTAEYHTPGTEISGNNIQHNERIININDLLISTVFIANIDEAMNHYDVRSVYSREMGIALANQMDKHVLQTLVQAAQVTTASPASETDRVGTVITNADIPGTAMESDADDLVDAIFAAAEALDEKRVPEDGRVIYVKPDSYYRLANSSKVINVDFGNAGNESTASGKIMRVAGMEVLKTNNLPTTNITTGVLAGDANARHAVNATNTVAIVAHPSAVGTVKLMDLKTEMEYQISKQGTLLVAKYAVGHGVLRPEAAVHLKSS